MRYKHNNKTGVNISEIAVGTWALGGLRYGNVNHDDSINAVRTMLENGVNIIDTAPAYGYGRSEMVVAEAIHGFDRSKLMLATKCGITPPTKLGGTMFKDGRYKPILRDCEVSLGLMQQDYFDFYIVHWPDPDTPVEETMSALNKLKSDGKIRFIGVSNFTIEQIKEAQQYAQIDAVQLAFNMVDQGKRNVFEWCEQQGMVTMTYGSLGSGILTGAIRTMPEFAKNDVRVTFYDYFREPKFSKIQTLLKTLDDIAEAHKVPVSQVSINWSTQKTFISTALAGARNDKEAFENMAAFSWSLNNEEIARIDAAITRLELDK